MNRPCSKNRFSIALSLLLGWSLALPGLAAEISLRPFSASYDLYRGGMHVAVTSLRLEPSGDHWRWSSLTRARGVFAWFTDKQPYAETSFSLAEDGIQLHDILLADAGNGKNHESARFDWNTRKIDVLRKGKSRQLEFEAGVYDYQSIHLLAASMGRRQLEQATIDFYRKGKLVKSRLVYSGQQQVNLNGEDVGANVYEQMTVRSNSKIKYYYDAENPLLPLRIEKLESGESPVVLSLRKVEWDL